MISIKRTTSAYPCTPALRRSVYVGQKIRYGEKMSKSDFMNNKDQIITGCYKRWSDPGSEIVKRMNSFAEKSPDILKPKLES